VPVVLAVFVARLFQLQIVEGQSFRDQAYENRIRTISIPSPRGVVYDRNGVLLVRNVPQYNVMITPALLPDSPAEVDAIYQRISALSGVPVDLRGAAAAYIGPGIIELVRGLTTARSVPGRGSTSMRPWGASKSR
jgi:cell division protein FtsI/penicillin-binding protein 2